MNGADLAKEIAATSSKKSDEELIALAIQLGERAEKYQWDGDQERAVESWYEMRDLMPDHDLPLDSQIALLASLRFLKRDGEIDAVLKEFFFGPPQKAWDIHVP